MLALPRHDGSREFETGGAIYIKLPSSITILFYTKNGRTITEVGIPYFLAKNGRDVHEMIANAWESACDYVSEKHLSRPDLKTAKLMLKDIQELLNV